MDVNNSEAGFSIEKARMIQLRLSRRIVRQDMLPRKIRFVAGVDVAYAKGHSFGAVAVLDYETLKILESRTAVCQTRVPYIPTLLSFRESSPAVQSIRKLHIQPDVFLVDAHGVAHPYGCGFASHLGIVIKKPTVGVAKNRLFGDVEESKEKRDVAFLRNEGEVIGAAVTTKRKSKPVYVSIGHMVSLETSIGIVKHCTQNSRIPEPIREADRIATTEKRKANIASTFNK